MKLLVRCSRSSLAAALSRELPPLRRSWSSFVFRFVLIWSLGELIMSKLLIGEGPGFSASNGKVEDPGKSNFT